MSDYVAPFSLADSYNKGVEIQTRHNQDEADAAWQKQARARQVTDWGWQDKDREYTYGRRATVDGQEDTKYQQGQDDRTANAPLLAQKRQLEGLQNTDAITNAPGDFALDRQTKQLGVQKERVGISAAQQQIASSRQEMGIRSQANSREQESHNADMARHRQIDTINNQQIDASNQLGKIHAMAATDPAGAAREMEKLFDSHAADSGVTSHVSYHPENDTWGIASVKGGKMIANHGFASSADMFRTASSVIAPYASGSQLLANASIDAKHFSDDNKGRAAFVEKWTTRFTAHPENISAADSKEMGADPTDGATSQQVSDYVETMANRAFPSSKQWAPPAAKAKAPLTSGLSNAASAAGDFVGQAKAKVAALKPPPPDYMQHARAAVATKGKQAVAQKMMQDGYSTEGL
jgi:hypothetical protein